MSVKEEERICPICGGDNNCQHGQGDCWCDKVKFPKKIFDIIPEDKKGKACVCKTCLEKFQK
ncbi:cysteine-rich CWC family protein [Irregularibacter muris]|uniref:Cysteine-rich CWC family protein n=1 Tax=Irregularibacter muris TaxID=1796619 RepID=A0AAE3HEB6_9FIRM|nr:cysteine-rich CWC family protein [Irregularibacter muris]MCR1897909.1 cysteine-rich CWC family protein [Irregularibacter muris]